MKRSDNVSNQGLVQKGLDTVSNLGLTLLPQKPRHFPALGHASVTFSYARYPSPPFPFACQSDAHTNASLSSDPLVYANLGPLSRTVDLQPCIYRFPSSVILEQHADTLPIMHPPNRLSEDAPDIQNLQFRTPPLMLFLRHAVRHDDLIQCAGIDPLDCIAGQYAMGQQGEHFRRALLLEELGGPGDGV